MIEFNDRRGHRGRCHINLIAARLPDGQQVIFEFAGASVPGVVQVVKKDYNKNGKWSAAYWTVELADGVLGFVRSQDWETGDWLNARRWREAIAEFTGNEPLDAEAVERFVRCRWPEIARRLDTARTEALADGSAALAVLLVAQEELATAQAEHAAAVAEVAMLEQAEIARIEAMALAARTARAREAMQQGVGLADLKAMLSREEM